MPAATRVALARMTARHALGWFALVAVLELLTRTLVYAMAPTAGEASRTLGGQLGGPGFVAVLVVAVGLGAVTSVGVVWFTSMGVRERWALSDRRSPGAAPRIALRPVLVRALALTLVGWLTFAGVETVIHSREGLGFHGLECLIGPVHRNALPVVGGLALLASALLSAAAHVLAWMRRTVGRLVAPRPASRRRRPVSLPVVVAADIRAPLVRGAPPRGPPLPVV